MGASAVAWPHPCGQSAQPFDPFVEQVGSLQCMPVGLPGLGKFVVIGVVLMVFFVGSPLSSRVSILDLFLAQ